MPPNAERARARSANQSPRDDAQSVASTGAPVNADPFSLAIRAAVAVEIDRLRDELAEIVSARPLPRMLDSAGVCQWLDISTPTLRKLEAEGLPVVRLGEVRRFDVETVRQWLASRGQP